MVFSGRGRVTTLSSLDEGSLPTTSFLFPGELADGCRIDGAVFLHGFRPGDRRVVHRYDTLGAPMTSFAEVYRSENRIVEKQLSLGHLACVEDSKTLLLAPMFLPELRAYSPTGTLLWWALLEGFEPVEVGEFRGGSKLRLPPEGFHIITGLVASAESDRAILQVKHRIPQSNRTLGSTILHSFMIDPSRKAVTYIGDTLSPILYWNSRLTVEYEEAPFPLVRISTH
jgi:hypothetical protein